MKNLLQSFLLLVALLGFGVVSAQPCTVDPQYTAPGIYPSDTLQDMTVNTATNQVIQFVFPVDTVLFGFTLNFDSFKVSSVSNIPPGALWECNQNHPTCLYVSNPPNLTRGCVKVYGTPTTQNAAYPNYDSLIVTGTAYVTVPFIGVQSVAQDISIYFRVQGAVSNANPFELSLNMGVSPNPMVNRTELSYNLAQGANTTISIVDMLGKEVLSIDNGLESAGQKNVSLNTSNLEGGIYFLRLDINGGEYVKTQKIAVIR